MTAYQAKAADFLKKIQQDIPLTVAMQLSVQAYNGQALTLAVPLSPNVNDKGTGFAGSITALGSVAGWTLLSLWCEETVGPCRIAIADAHFAFKKPIQSDFVACAVLPDAAVCTAMQEALLSKGRCKVNLSIGIEDNNGLAASLEARYALWREAC